MVLAPLVTGATTATTMKEIDVDLRNPSKLAERREAERAVLEYLGTKAEPQKPANLIQQVANKQRISEAFVQQAVWVLLDRETIRLTGTVEIFYGKS